MTQRRAARSGLTLSPGFLAAFLALALMTGLASFLLQSRHPPVGARRPAAATSREPPALGENDVEDLYARHL